MKFVLMPDSFKGTLSSEQICQIMTEEIQNILPNATAVSVPVADGGEGSVDAFLSAVGGEKVYVTVKGPYFEDVEGFYSLIDQGKTAVIEMAAAAGLPLVGDRKCPSLTTTYGVGQLMLHALQSGAKKIILGLGGSATNDGGCGAAAALGVAFYDRDGKAFIPTGGTLKNIDRIDMSHIFAPLKEAEVVTMCDIDNPMYGERGAAYIFAPQKGADEQEVRRLDEGLVHLAEVLLRDTKKDLSTLKGAGAAGAMGAGTVAFFDATLQMGIETVLDTVGFDGLVSDADFVITGEGKLDGQSLGGKVIDGIARRAKAQSKPVIAIVGGVVDKEIQPVYEAGVTAVFPACRLPVDFSVSRAQSEENLRYTVRNALRLMKTMQKEN